MNIIRNFLNRPLIMMLLISFVLLIILEPINTSLFAGSAWRNTQSFAPYMCFQDSNDIYGFLKCFFAPNLGFDDKAYSGLELPLLPMLDYILNSKISIYYVQSKVQLFAIILVLMSFLFLSKFRFSSVLLLGIIFIGIIDNPTLYFHILSYQPDLFSIALILFGISLLLQEDKSYIPEILIGIGILFKPQHALIAFTTFMYLRVVYHNNYADIFKRSIIIIGIILLSLVSAKMSQFMGISESYPSLTAILGGFDRYGNIAFNYFIQMFQRNGIEFLGITVVILLSALFIIENKTKIFYLLIILFLTYIFTFCFFLTGFIVNIYYGSVLSLVFMIILIVSFSELSNYLFKSEKSGFYINVLLSIIFIISLVFVVRPKDFYTQILTDRKEICSPKKIRSFITEQKITGTFILNEPPYEPTIKVSIGSGSNLWFQNLDENYINLIKKQDNELYYFTCAHFTEMLKNDFNKYKLINENFKEFYNQDDWILYKLKKN